MFPGFQRFLFGSVVYRDVTITTIVTGTMNDEFCKSLMIDLLVNAKSDHHAYFKSVPVHFAQFLTHIK